MNKSKRLLSLVEDILGQTVGLIMPEAAGMLLKCGDKGLFLKRSNEDLDSPGDWSYVAGGIIDGETPYDTAIREMQEEIGVSPSFQLLGEFQHGKFVTFLGEVKEEFEPILNHEHESFGWYNFSDQNLDPLHPGVYPAIQYFGLV